jgi:phage-related protein
MASLADLYVRIVGRDRELRKTVGEAKRSLIDLDRQKVEPDISLPQKPVADIKALSKQLDTLARKKVGLNVNSTLATAEVKSLGRQLETLQAKRHTVDVDLQPGLDKQIADIQRELAKFERREIKIPLTIERVDDQIAAVRAKLEALSAESADVEVDVDADTTSAWAKLRALTLREHVARIRADVDSTTLANASRGISNLTTAIIALGPAVLPILAATTAAVGGIGAAALGAAGAGGTLGASIAGVTHEMTEAKDEQKKAATTARNWAAKQEMARAVLAGTTKGTKEYDAALRQYQATSQKASLYQDQLNTMQETFNENFGPAARGLEAVQRAWGRFMDATRPATVRVMGQAMQVLADLLPRLAPVANATAVAVGNLFDRFGAFVNGPQMAGVIDFLATRGPAMLTTFVNIATNVTRGIISLFTAFLPITDQVTGGLERMTARFAAWSAQLGQSQGFQNFIAYVRTNAPAVMSFIANIFGTVVRLTQALAPMGAAVLAVVSAISAGFNRLPIPVIQVLAGSIGAVVAVLKLWQLGVFAAAAAHRIATVATVAFRVAMLAVNVVLRANPIGLVITAITALVAGLIYAYKHSEKFRSVVQTVWAAIKTAFTASVAAIKTAIAAIFSAWRSVVASLQGVWNAVVSAVRSAVDAVVGAWRSATGALSSAFGAIRSAVSTAFTAIANVIRTATGIWLTVVKVVITAILTVVIVQFTLIKNVVAKLWGGVYSAVIKPVWDRIRAIFTTTTAAIRAAWTVFWNALRTGAAAIWNAVYNGVIRPVWVRIKSIFTTTMAAVRSAWASFWNTVRSTANAVWTAVYNGVIRPVWTRIRSLFSTTMAALRSAWSTFWNALRTGAAAIFNAIYNGVIVATWNRIRSAFSAASTAVRNTMSTMWSALRTGTTTAMNALKRGVDTVLDKIKDAFRTAKESIRRTWDGVKDVVSAPIQWVKNNVYNKPLVPVWNRVADLVNGPKLRAYARGGIAEAEAYANGGTPYGVRPGYTPGRDTHLVGVGGGEAIMRPEWTRAVGPALVHLWNRVARTKGVAGVRKAIARMGAPEESRPRGFANGGVVRGGSVSDWLRDKLGSAAGAVKGLASKIKGWAIGGLKAAAEAVLKPVRGLISRNLSGSPLRSSVGTLANKAIDGVLSKIGISDDKAMADQAGAAPGGSNYKGPVGRGMSGVIALGRRLGFGAGGTYPGHHPSMARARDFMNTNVAKGNNFASALWGARKKLGLWYIIWNRRIISQTRPGAGWTRYFDGGSSNPNRAHTNHLHVAVYRLGGIVKKLLGQSLSQAPVKMAAGGIVRGGRGGTLAHIGEGRHDELVAPLPKGWNAGAREDKIDRLCKLIEAYGLQGNTVQFGDVIVPAGGSVAQEINRELQMAANVGLV